MAPTAPKDAPGGDAASDPPRPLVGSEPWTALAAWAADELGVRLEFDGRRFQIVEVDPDESAGESASESTIRRRWFRRRRRAAEASEPSAEREPFSADTPIGVVDELVRRLNAEERTVDARPVSQPTAVHELSARLFDAYTLDGGQAHLAGCHFEDVPLVRLTCLADGEDASPRVEHRFFDELGTPLPWAEAESLGVERVAPMTEPPPRLDAGRLERMLASAQRAAPGDAPELVTLVWAKKASGRLRFEFGDESLDTEFEGWARTLTAPAITCPATGAPTFHLATTDDGQIAAAEAIVPSVVTGRRALASGLVACAATGKLAEAEHFTPCAASGEPVLDSELVACSRCGLRVAPAARHAGDCDACRAAERVAPDAATWAKIVATHPKLAAKKWQVTQTEQAFLLESNGWLRRHVVTIDRESLKLLHAAEASRFSSAWRPLALAGEAR